ncbi:MAG: HD domain-containing phosphohydrolase [Panacagrimonas sp.]
MAAMDAAVEQHRLVTAERVLLGQTLLGSVKALTDVLALTQPLAFGRSTRLKQLVADLATAMELRERWQVEVAAMLSQLGSLALPVEVVERLYYGAALRAEDEVLLKRVPETIENLLGHIPRLEVVRAILAGVHGVTVAPRAGLSVSQQSCAETGVALLLVAQGFDTLEAQGSSPQLAIDTLRSRKGVYRADVLEALSTIRGDTGVRREVREVPLGGLRPGMMFAEDVKMDTGALFVPRGYEITSGLIERIRSLRSGAIKGVVRVIVPGTLRESV